MFGIIVIVMTLLALMYFAYRGVSVLVLSPILAMLAVLLTREFPALYALSNMFMPAAAGYISNYFPVFLAGAIFGKLMGESGAASSIAHFITRRFGARRAIVAVVAATGLLTYGGVSLFVVVFAIYPIGAMLLREADVPKRFLPAAITLGAFTFTMTALPGTPQYINTMPTIYFGTDIYAAPVLGIFAALIMAVGGTAWLAWRIKIAKGKGEGYGNHQDEGFSVTDDSARPTAVLAFIPLLIVFIINFVLTNYYFKLDSVIAYYAGFSDTKINGT